jgi:mono/diheme cytochrome c family protein
MKKTLLGATVGLIALGFLAGGPRTATATVDMQKKAKAAGVEVQNCLHCHGEKLPKKGASTLNDKGKWLVGEKDKRKAKEVDPAWLKEYVEPTK